MSPLAQKPILHGRDHCPGGADPIPCMISGPGVGDVIYGEYVQSLGPIGYWRLGETGSPWADTSGESPPADLSLEAHGVAMTADVTGALPAAQDDGAVQFNYTGTAANGGDYLTTGPPSPNTRYQLNPLSVAAFVSVHAYPASQGLIAGSIGFVGSAYSGWALKTLSSGEVFFTLGGTAGAENTVNSPGPVVLDDWYHVAATYDGDDMLLYLNGVLVNTTAYTAAPLFGQTDGIKVAHLEITASHLYFAGSLDELAVWDYVLSAEEIAALASATESAGGTEGHVLTSDGAGGTSWAAPTIEVEF